MEKAANFTSRQNCGQLDGRGMSDGRGEERACSLGCHVPGKPSRAASGRGARERRLVLQVAGSAARGAASGNCSWWAAEALVRSPASPGVPLPQLVPQPESTGKQEAAARAVTGGAAVLVNAARLLGV